MQKFALFLAALVLMLAAGCARMPNTGVTSLKAETLSELQTFLLKSKADVDQFRLRGPFAVTTQTDFQVILPSGRITADLFLSEAAGKAPLVILLHGYDGSKDAHTFQAMHLASWGMHSLALELPNRSRWVSNGKTLAQIVSAIQRRPELVDPRVDVGKIILVGHSFGGSSVATALADGARAAGGILLDPAAIGRELPNSLKKIGVPVMLLGADENISAARNRDYFYRFIPSGIAELSIKDATHEDGQYPSEREYEDEPAATEEMQITFVSALTAAALSIAATGKLDYAWASFRASIENGKFFNAKKK